MVLVIGMFVSIIYTKPNKGDDNMIKIGDKVCFKNSVVIRAEHDKYIADMRGEVLDIIVYGKIAKVECGETFTGQDGKTVRYISIANLTKFLLNGAIPNWT